MATQTGRTEPNEQPGRGPSAAAMQRRYIEAPLEASRQPIVDAAMDLAELMGNLPRAFVDSQQRELDRMKKYGKEDDPRIADLEASIRQVAVLATTAHREQARIQRVFGALGDSDGILHGFVSSAEFAPLPGLTVRLIAPADAGTREALTSITDDEGYYRISGLPTMVPSDGLKRSQSLASQIAYWFSGSQATRDAAPATDKQDIGNVEIWKDDQQVYRDPVPIVLGDGGIFREYVIAVNAPEAPSDASVKSGNSDSRATRRNTARRPRKAAQKDSSRKRKK